MSNEQAKVMENLDGVLFVSPEKSYELHTTHSPWFLGLHQNKGVWEDSHYGKEFVIALLDSGITPGHPSFDDKGIPPPPLRWKGKCEVSGCNKKLIEIRNFVTGDSVIDMKGHGTHTSSTTAGSYVNNASVFEQANGTATGMAPLAHLAMYKVCATFGCLASDILAGMDKAIEDGADVISLSLGGPPVTFYNDPIAIGAFTAIKSGIFVSCSAGNFRTHNKTLSNEAPWILTVGASKTDRRIRTTVTYGNKKMLNGEALYQPKTYKLKVQQLVYPAGMGYSCSKEELKLIDVKGKILLLEVQVLPLSHVGYREGVAIKKYLNSTSAPVATIIQHGTHHYMVEYSMVRHHDMEESSMLRDQDTGFSPMVWDHDMVGSSMVHDDQVENQIVVLPEALNHPGPNIASTGILKPDIVGPGVDILAAWHKSVDNNTGTQATLYIISGTSMSCPHLAGLATLIKSTHPDWSPAAIKSAIMTKASNRYKDTRLVDIVRSQLGAGMDKAIEDGADVISLSLGGPPVTFYNDPIAIGAFTAIKSGIFVSCSAGNFRPHNKTLSNEAPWILTVGASKTDRRIRTTVTYGNKKMLNGEALYQPKTYKLKVQPLVYPAGMGYSCSKEELKLIDVKGKIVLLEVQVLPSSHVGYREGVAIKKYLNSTSAPVATIIQHGTAWT
nr:peptidase S8/S53 domain-containing protein [Tanacetum cinerariifolium]